MYGYSCAPIWYTIHTWSKTVRSSLPHTTETTQHFMNEIQQNIYPSIHLACWYLSTVCGGCVSIYPSVCIYLSIWILLYTLLTAIRELSRHTTTIVELKNCKKVNLSFAKKMMLYPILKSSKSFFCLKLKISITTEIIGFCIWGKIHIGPVMVLANLCSDLNLVMVLICFTSLILPLWIQNP